MHVPTIRRMYRPSRLVQLLSRLEAYPGWLILCAAVVSWLALAGFVASVMALMAQGGVS